MSSTDFEPVRVIRKTAETVFAVVLRPREQCSPSVQLPNRLLAHFLDHLARASGIAIHIEDLAWPGSWMFDHVLCEDLGQLVGRGVAAVHDSRAAIAGVPGRAAARVCMDETVVECTLSFEGRTRCQWLSPTTTIGGFVDAWYDDAGEMSGWSAGSNLQQFFDGFAIGAQCTLTLDVRACGNLHHVFEAAFRALGDAIGSAAGTAASNGRLAGDSSGLAGVARYTVERVEDTACTTRS